MRLDFRRSQIATPFGRAAKDRTTAYQFAGSQADRQKSKAWFRFSEADIVNGRPAGVGGRISDAKAWRFRPLRYSKLKIFFQSFFMLMTGHPAFAASS
jgi:hypothetical protein